MEQSETDGTKGVPVPRLILALFGSLVVAVITGLSVRIIDLTVDINGAQIRLQTHERSINEHTVKLYEPRWSATNQHDFQTEHKKTHRDNRRDARTNLLSLRAEFFSSLQETKRRLAVHEAAGAHVRADERLSRIERDLRDIKKRLP